MSSMGRKVCSQRAATCAIETSMRLPAAGLGALEQREQHLREGLVAGLQVDEGRAALHRRPVGGRR